MFEVAVNIKGQKHSRRGMLTKAATNSVIQIAHSSASIFIDINNKLKHTKRIAQFYILPFVSILSHLVQFETSYHLFRDTQVFLTTARSSLNNATGPSVVLTTLFFTHMSDLMPFQPLSSLQDFGDLSFSDLYSMCIIK